MSRFLLHNFWAGYSHSQELHIDATMLRAVHWCEIGGFEDWWKRLANDITGDVLHGGMDPIATSYLAANMARADYARKLMPKTLERMIDIIEFPYHTNADSPWQHVYNFPEPGEYSQQLVTHFGYAANLAFTTFVIRNEVTNIAKQACDTIMKGQTTDGWVPIWEPWELPDIETTARAVHALALCRPRGWQHATDRGSEWLLSIQEDGNWHEESMPDVPFLTVLVLDALSLASGSSVATFEFSTRSSQAAGTPRSRTIPRFKIALSFPGESRDLVDKIADQLAKEYGEQSVLYDRFHEAEFARPNLDIYLQRLYHEDSALVVVFLSKDYSLKEWCGLEWRAIRDLIKSRHDSSIMLIRIDDTEIKGIYPIDGYIDAGKKGTKELASLIIQRRNMLNSS